jgi:hypothetical protein
MTKNENKRAPLSRVTVVGHDTEKFVSILRNKVFDLLPVEVIDVWHNIFNTDEYVPPILKADSYDYVSSAGLGL